MSNSKVAIITEQRAGCVMPLGLLASAIVLQGTFAVVDTSGYGIDSQKVGGADQICLGVYAESVENTGADGEAIVMVERKKQFLVKNSSTDPVSQADLGIKVYVEDNQTIAKTSNNGSLSLAGTFMGFDSQYKNYVWVEIN